MGGGGGGKARPVDCGRRFWKEKAGRPRLSAFSERKGERECRKMAFSVSGADIVIAPHSASFANRSSVDCANWMAEDCMSSISFGI